MSWGQVGRSQLPHFDVGMLLESCPSESECQGTSKDRVGDQGRWAPWRPMSFECRLSPERQYRSRHTRSKKEQSVSKGRRAGKTEVRMGNRKLLG